MEKLQNEEIVDQTTEDRRWCVYMHICKANNKKYIGFTSQSTDKRWQRGYGYLNKNKDGTYKQPLMARAVLKYSNWDNDWEHIIFAEQLSNYDARIIERLLITLYDTTNPSKGYNICPGGELSPMYGRRHSQETLDKMKANHPRLCGEKAPHYGKPHLEEVKQQISETKRNSELTKNNEYVNSIRIEICQYTKQGTYVDEYVGVQTASDKTGISRSAIANCLCGISKTAGGYIWKKKYDPLTDEDIANVNSRKSKKSIQSKNN